MYATSDSVAMDTVFFVHKRSESSNVEQTARRLACSLLDRTGWTGCISCIIAETILPCCIIIMKLFTGWSFASEYKIENWFWWQSLWKWSQIDFALKQKHRQRGAQFLLVFFLCYSGSFFQPHERGVVGMWRCMFTYLIQPQVLSCPHLLTVLDCLQLLYLMLHNRSILLQLFCQFSYYLPF